MLSLVLSAVAVIQRGEAQDAQTRAEEQQAVAEEQQAIAEEQADLSLSRQLASQALLNLDRQPDLAILLALEGYRVAPTDEAHQSLLTAAQLSGSVERMIHGAGPIRAPSLSPSGSLLAGSLASDTVTVWDLATGEIVSELGTFDGEQRSPDKLSFGATDDELVISYGRVVVIVDATSGEVLEGPFRAGTIDGFPSQLLQGRVDPSGRFLVVGNSVNALVWDLRTDGRVAMLEHPDLVVDVEFSRDGSLVATVGGSGEIRLWKVGSWKAGPVLSGQFFAAGAAFSADNAMVATTGSDGLVRWSTETGERIGAPLRGHDGEVVTVDLTPDGTLMATGGTDGTVRLWDPETGVQVGPAIEGHDDAIRWVAFTPDGAELVVAPNDTIFVRSIEGILGVPVGDANGAIALVGFSLDGSQLVVADGPPGGIHLLDPATGHPTADPLRNELSAWAVSASPGGLLAVPDSTSVRIWDPSTREEVVEPLVGPGGRIWHLAFNPDGSRLAVATAHKRILVWDTATWELAGVIEEAYHRPAAYVAFSPDGSTLYSVGAYEWLVKAWNGADLTPLGEPAEAFAPLSVNVSPDGEPVVSTGQERPLALYDADLQPLPAFATDAARASSSAFTPDGKVLAVGSDDGAVRLFDVASGEQLGGPVGGHPDWVMSVAFSPDGSKLVSGGQDGTIRIWDSVLWSDDLEEFRAALCRSPAGALPRRNGRSSCQVARTRRPVGETDVAAASTQPHAPAARTRVAER